MVFSKNSEFSVRINYQAVEEMVIVVDLNRDKTLYATGSYIAAANSAGDTTIKVVYETDGFEGEHMLDLWIVRKEDYDKFPTAAKGFELQSKEVVYIVGRGDSVLSEVEQFMCRDYQSLGMPPMLIVLITALVGLIVVTLGIVFNQYIRKPFLMGKTYLDAEKGGMAEQDAEQDRESRSMRISQVNLDEFTKLKQQLEQAPPLLLLGEGRSLSRALLVDSVTPGIALFHSSTCNCMGNIGVCDLHLKHANGCNDGDPLC